MTEYKISNIYLNDFSFSKKQWLGSFNIVLTNDKSCFYCNVPFSFFKQWHFKDFSFPLDCSQDNRFSIRKDFNDLAMPICDTLFSNHILPREQTPFIPDIQDLVVVNADHENKVFKFSFKLAQHQPTFFLNIYFKENLFYYNFTCSKRFYDAHVSSIYFDFHLFSMLEPMILSFKEHRFLLASTPFQHKEKPTFNVLH